MKKVYDQFDAATGGITPAPLRIIARQRAAKKAAKA